MSSRFSLSAVAAVLFLFPAPLLAGGLPRVCVPVNGVTTDTADACAKLVREAFDDKAERVELRENGKQWYALFSLNAAEADLGKLDAAFKGSRFSIPRDGMRLFARVKLEVEIGEASGQKLLTDLKAVKYLTLEHSKRESGVLLVTVATPFPQYNGREIEEFGKVAFEKERFGGAQSDLTPKADPPAAARDLPTLGDLRAVVEKHDGKLKGSRFQLLGCHVQGGVIVPTTTPK